jgi:hypothetical protein
VPWLRWILPAWAAVLVAALALSYAGALGPLVVCGIDAAPTCVAWPRLASALIWLSFIATTVGLAVWHVRHWRGTSVSRAEWLAIAAILLVALVERTARLDLTQLAYDESAAASLVAAWRFDGLFALTGIVSSVGIPNPPGWPYLLALAVVPFDTPYALVALGVLNGLAAIALVWWLGRRWIGPWGGLAAAVFYAGGFWSMVLGRGGWQPEFLQIPVILCLDALLMLAVRRNPWALAVAAGWVGLMVQLHYVALLFAAMLVPSLWPARHDLRPRHVVTGALLAITLLAPFLMYELHPAIRLKDFTSLAADQGVTARFDLDSWSLTWVLASNGGAAGLGGPDTAGLAQALGRWAQLGLIGIPLVAAGAIASVLFCPRGWRGWLIALWFAAPIVLLVRHTQGVLFHYLYLALPGMALCVGALLEWSKRYWRIGVAAALALYVGVSAATLAVVLDHVGRTGEYPALGKPLGSNLAGAAAARAALTPGGQVLVGGYTFEVAVLRFALGFGTPSRIFDDCGDIPLGQAPDVYLLNSERTPALGALEAAGAPVLARVARPNGDAFVVLGPPTRQPIGSSEAPACAQRFPD